MEAKELHRLMVGDYVYNTHNKKNEQVQQILELGVMLDYNDIYNADDIKPIPLKRIHITKNGFKATNAEDTEFVYRNGYEVKVMIDEYMKETIFLSINFAEKELWMPIEYVHELQQAMRLFGIEKEIKL